MPALDWGQCPAVESVPGKVSGAWVFKNTRMPVSIVFENMQSGASMAEVMEWFGVEQNLIEDALQFVIDSLEKPPSYQWHFNSALLLKNLRKERQVQRRPPKGVTGKGYGDGE